MNIGFYVEYFFKNNPVVPLLAVAVTALVTWVTCIVFGIIILEKVINKKENK